MIAQSGTPFTVICEGRAFSPIRDSNGRIVGNSGCDYNADGAGNDRPNVPAFGSSLSGLSNDDFLSGIFTAADFPTPAPGVQGTLGRNTFRGPRYFNVDFSIGRTIRIPAVGAEQRGAAASRDLQPVQHDEPRSAAAELDEPAVWPIHVGTPGPDRPDRRARHLLTGVGTPAREVRLRDPRPGSSSPADPGAGSALTTCFGALHSSAPDTDNPHVVDHLVLAVALATPAAAPFPRRPLCSTRGSTPHPCIVLHARSREMAPSNVPPRHGPRRQDCGAPSYDCALAHVETPEVPRRDLRPSAAARANAARSENPEPLGIALTGAGRVDEANARFREALGIDQTFTPARKNLAVNEFNQGRFQLARRDFEQVLAQLPGDEVAHVHLAEIGYAPQTHARRRSALREGGRACDGQPVVDPSLWRLPARARQTGARDHRASQACQTRMRTAVRRGSRARHAPARTRRRPFFAAARRHGYTDSYAAGYNEALMLVEAADPMRPSGSSRSC